MDEGARRRYRGTMEIITTAHSDYRLEYHEIWVCKYRERILKPGVCSYLRKIFPMLLRSMPGVDIKQIGFDDDHLHMIMTIPPKYSISQ